MNNTESISNWIPGAKRPIIIAGPCGAESEEQVFRTVNELKDLPVHAIRAGIWKPRSHPGSFDGMGTVALKWLKEAGIAIVKPVTVEVASSKHVELALKAGIDILWIGARTTVNPFLVQEIAESLTGVDVPVLIKNPVSPDLELWIGAIERISKAGIKKIAAIHRGFSSFENSTYRNKPNWEIPIELRRRVPGISLLCDPSHICGNTTLLQYVSQTAMDLNYDGLMIETHFNPAEAKSDAKQQLKPAELKKLLIKLVLRSISVDDVFELSKLEDMRDQIDEIDDEMIEVLAKRMLVARLIGKYKKENNVAILQPERWEEIIRTRTKSGLNKKLTKDFLSKLISIIHEESIIQQTIEMNREVESEKSKV